MPSISYAIYNGTPFASIDIIALNFLYHLISISLIEEIYFRGYLFTRLEGVIFQTFPRVLICSALFSLMHVPFQIVSTNLGVLEYISYNSGNLFFLFLFGIYLSFVYSKTNNIIAPVIVHTLFNLISEVFI